MTLAKVNGKALDDIATINGVAVIGLGDALVGEVMDGKFFYAGSTTLLEGTLATVALAPGSDAYPAGYHAGNVGGLVAIEADLVRAKIREGFTIFGKVGIVPIHQLSVADFQANPATGTFRSLPEFINEGSPLSRAFADLNQYAEVVYPESGLIRRWRQYGHAANNGDGFWKIQYWDLESLSWEDWVTDIPTRGGTWSTLETETEKITSKIKLICTTADTGADDSVIGELEVIY